MASAVGAMPAVHVAAASSSFLSWPRASIQSTTRLQLPFCATFPYIRDGRTMLVSAVALDRGCTRAIQTRVSVEGLFKAVLVSSPRVSSSSGIPFLLGVARRGRISATEGQQTAEPAPAAPVSKSTAEPAPAAPVSKSAASKNEGKSTFDIVREVISEQLAVAVTEVEPNTKFVDLGADSLDTVEIMMSLEDRFDITIEEDGTEKIATVKDAADLIDQVRKNK